MGEPRIIETREIFFPRREPRMYVVVGSLSLSEILDPVESHAKKGTKPDRGHVKQI